MLKIEAELTQVNADLNDLKPYQVKYYENLLKKYGKGRERKTEIKVFDTIQANQVAIANQKLYVNREEGFIGTGLKKDEYICDCSDIDDIIVFRRNGKMQVSKVQDKLFVGKDILYVDVFRKNDERKVYNMIYLDGKTKVSYAKRFNVMGVTRDKEYDLTTGAPNSKILYFTANLNSEAELVEIVLSPLSHARKLSFDFNFAELAIKGRSVLGNTVSKYLLKGVKLKSKGVSTMGGRKIFYDDVLGRLNVDERGTFLGEFDTNDRILVIYKDGNYELTDFELTNHYEAEQVMFIHKFRPKRTVTLVYWNDKDKYHFIKRFVIETLTINKKFLLIPEGPKNKIILATDQPDPVVVVKTGVGKTASEEEQNLTAVIDVKGWKAIGNKYIGKELNTLTLLPPNPDVEEEEDEKSEIREEKDPQMTLLNEDIEAAEQERIKKLLEDDEPLGGDKPRIKPKKIDNDQPKLF
jgi:topoisomerase-4 subunit A